MGVEYRAAIVVGLPKEELEDLLDEYDDPSGDSGLEHFPPYYDADYSEGVWGISVVETPDYTEREIDTGEFGVKLRAAQHKFHALTGKAGKLYVTPVGW